MSVVIDNTTSDREILAALEGRKLAEHKYTHVHYGLLENVGLLVCSATLEAPSGKQYRGHIGIGQLREWDQGQLTWTDPMFVGFCTFGKVDGEQAVIYGKGHDLDTVLKQVNRKLREKQTPRKSYRPLPGTGAPLLDRQQVVAAAREILDGGYPTAQLQQNGVTV